MWIKGNYRRIFLDMHIDDWNEEFMSKVNPKRLVEVLKNARAQQVVVKCRSHTGLAFYPTKIGRMHKGLKGMDYVKEMSELCHQEGIAVMAYFSQIFDNWAYENHPDWRIINGEGKTSREYEEYGSPMMFRKGRYGMVCPNNKDYREYVKGCLTEITKNYDFESIFLDMPFWSEVCYCPSCKERYFKQTGLELPRTINWSDPEFREWQAIREEWMGEFAAFSTDCIKNVKEKVTIEHNMSIATAPWQFGTTDLIADACDYVGGDLYGGYLEQTFACKYYRNLTKVLPFVFISSRCDPSLQYHTTTKSVDELLLHTLTALVHNGAFSICDGANPDGTINNSVYEGVVKDVFTESQKYEKYVSGNLLTNVAIWFPSRSKYDWRDNGKDVCSTAFHDSFFNDFINNPVQMAKILRGENIPFDVIPSKRLSNMSDDTLVISNVVSIRDEEMAEIEAFIRDGGSVYISGLLGHKDFYKLLDATNCGMTEENVTYMNPTEVGKRFFTDFDKQSPMAVQEQQHRMKIKGDYELLATLTLPYTMTGKREFSAIHSNPPGRHTDYPAAIIKKVGKGQILWTAAPIENSKPYASRLVVGRMIRELSGELEFTSNAPSFVEIVGWEKDERHYLAALNQQEEAPVAPMFNIEITVPYKIKSARLVESDDQVEVEISEKSSTIKLPEVKIASIVELTI